MTHDATHFFRNLLKVNAAWLSGFEQSQITLLSSRFPQQKMLFKDLKLLFSQDPSVQKMGAGRKKTVSFSSMPSEKKVIAPSNTTPSSPQVSPTKSLEQPVLLVDWSFGGTVQQAVLLLPFGLCPRHLCKVPSLESG